MKPWQRAVLAGVLVVPIAGLAACQTGTDQADNSKYATTPVATPAPMPGEQDLKTVDYPLELTTKAAKLALGELGDLNVQSVITGRTGLVSAKAPDGRAVTVTVRRLAPFRTEYGITVTGPNDPAISDRINDHIVAALARGATPLSTNPMRSGQIETRSETEVLPQQ